MNKNKITYFRTTHVTYVMQLHKTIATTAQNAKIMISAKYATETEDTSTIINNSSK